VQFSRVKHVKSNGQQAQKPKKFIDRNLMQFIHLVIKKKYSVV